MYNQIMPSRLLIIYKKFCNEYRGTISPDGIILYGEKQHHSICDFISDIIKKACGANHLNGIYFSDGCNDMGYYDLVDYANNEKNIDLNKLKSEQKLQQIYFLLCENGLSNILRDIEYKREMREKKKEIDDKKNNFFCNIEQAQEYNDDLKYHLEEQDIINGIEKTAELISDLSFFENNNDGDSCEDDYKIFELKDYIEENKENWSYETKLMIVNNLAEIIKNMFD